MWRNGFRDVVSRSKLTARALYVFIGIGGRLAPGTRTHASSSPIERSEAARRRSLIGTTWTRSSTINRTPCDASRQFGLLNTPFITLVGTRYLGRANVYACGAIVVLSARGRVGYACTVISVARTMRLTVRWRAIGWGVGG